MSWCILVPILAATCFSTGEINCKFTVTEADIDVGELQKWMQVFADDPFFKKSKGTVILEKRSAPEFHEDVDNKCISSQDPFLAKRSDTFSSSIRFFPANKIMVQAMYALLKPNGVLQKEGFSRDGHIKTNGEANVLMSRPFASEDDLIDSLNRSKGKHLTDLDVAVGYYDTKKPLVAVTNYILTSKDVNALIEWLKMRKIITGGHERHTLLGRRLNLIVSYACCTETVVPALAPKFGAIKVMIG